MKRCANFSKGPDSRSVPRVVRRRGCRLHYTGNPICGRVSRRQRESSSTTPYALRYRSTRLATDLQV
jgi:hypothetical protein